MGPIRRTLKGPAQGPCKLEIHPVDEDGYDAEGYYFGVTRRGENIYRYGDGMDLDMFVRAPHREDAMRQVNKQLDRFRRVQAYGL